MQLTKLSKYVFVFKVDSEMFVAQAVCSKSGRRQVKLIEIKIIWQSHWNRLDENLGADKDDEYLNYHK